MNALVIFGIVAAIALAGINEANAKVQKWASKAASVSTIKTIPPGATLEYRINGQIAQSIPVPPGKYKITVQEIR